MNELIYFWIDKYRQFQDPNTHAMKFLFNDFGINLSSKYKVIHEKMDDGSLQFTINESKIKKFFSNESEEECFYSKRISDVKAIAGKNGAGKSTLLELLAFILSGHKTELFPDVPLKYCILWIDEDGSFKYDANNENRIFVSKISFNSSITSIAPKRYEKEVIFYSAVFNDECVYSYPYGKLSKLQDIRTQYLLQQDIENFNNNPDMYGLKDRLTCHTIMESIRQVNFVSAFINEEEFLSSIFVLPDKVHFRFSNGSLRNHINSFLEHFVSNEEDYLSEDVKISSDRDVINFANGLDNEEKSLKEGYKKIENDWIRFFNETKNLKLKIRFALIFANIGKYLNPVLNNWTISFNELNGGLNERKCEDLLNEIQSNIRNIVYDDTVNDLYECLENHSMGSYFEFDLSSEKLQKLLRIIFELKLHVPIMEMTWPRRLSSGESCYLRMFSRLYDSILNEKKFNSINNLEALFIIDEVDLYLHPEWQRSWLSKFIKGIKLIQNVTNVNLNLHLVLATHSPFMLTDFSSESIVRLAREEDLSTKAQNSESNTLAANIFDFLEGDFFLNSSIGEHIRRKIKDLVEEIDRTNKTKEPLGEYSKMIINNIGDPIIKTLLINRKGLQYDND